MNIRSFGRGLGYTLMGLACAGTVATILWIVYLIGTTPSGLDPSFCNEHADDTAHAAYAMVSTGPPLAPTLAQVQQKMDEAPGDAAGKAATMRVITYAYAHPELSEETLVSRAKAICLSK